MNRSHCNELDSKSKIHPQVASNRRNQRWRSCTIRWSSSSSRRVLCSSEWHRDKWWMMEFGWWMLLGVNVDVDVVVWIVLYHIVACAFFVPCCKKINFRILEDAKEVGKVARWLILNGHMDRPYMWCDDLIGFCCLNFIEHHSFFGWMMVVQSTSTSIPVLIQYHGLVLWHIHPHDINICGHYCMYVCIYIYNT